MSELILIILTVLVSYQRPIPEDLVYEFHLRNRSYNLYNTRFSIPVEVPYPGGELVSSSSKYIITANFETLYDSAYTFDFYPRLLCRKQGYGLVIEPLFRIGEIRGWPAIKWQNVLCGAYSRAYAFYQSPKVLLMAGRNKLQLNLEGLIAEEDPPMDMLFARYNGKKFYFSYFAGQLSSEEATDSSYYYELGKLYNRFISGHSLEYRSTNFSASFSEVVVYFSRTNFPDLYFLNPFMLYHPRVLDDTEGGEHNTFWIIAGNYWGKRYSTHLEFLVDDFHLPDPDQWAPHKLAWIFKSYIIDFPLNSTVSGISYTGATRWTYTHGLSLLYYNNKREVMGVLNENDFDKVEIFTRKHLSKSLDIKGNLNFKRKGEGSVSDRDIYWERGIDYPQDYFLTGIVEQRFGPGIEFYVHNPRISLRLYTEYDWIRNRSHVEGAVGKELRVEFSGNFGLW